MAETFDPLQTEGLVWRNPAEAEAKLARFRKAGAALMHAVWDWDGTVVPGTSSSWHVMRDALPKPLQKQHTALYRHYHDLQQRGELTSALEREWSARALKLHVNNSTPVSRLEEKASAIQPRAGAHAAFDALVQAGVPSVVLSAGVKDTIDMMARAHKIPTSIVLATELIIEDGIVCGWRPGSMIDSRTKQEMGHPELSTLRASRPNAILFGDQPHDADMFGGDGLRIRVDGQHTVASQPWEAYLAKSWEAGYDAVTTRDDLVAVAGLNRWLVSQPE